MGKHTLPTRTRDHARCRTEIQNRIIEVALMMFLPLPEPGLELKAAVRTT